MHRSALLTFCVVGILTILAAPAYALLSIDDNFDSDGVGAFPSGWTNALGPSASEVYVTNSISGTPSAPNVLFMHFTTNAFPYEFVAPLMTTTTLSHDEARPFSVTFDTRVDKLQADGSASLFLDMQTAVGSADVGEFRWLADVGGTWQFFPNWTNQLSTGVWYNVRIDTVITNAADHTGYTRYYLNNTLFRDAAFDMDSFGTGGRTNITGLLFQGYVVAATGSENLIFIDNLQLSIVPEPSTVMLLGVGGWLLWRVRRFRLR